MFSNAQFMNENCSQHNLNNLVISNSPYIGIPSIGIPDKICKRLLQGVEIAKINH